MSLIKIASFDRYRIQSLAILLLFFTLPFPRKFSSIAIGIVLFFTLLVIFKKENYAKIRIHWFLPTLFLFYVASSLLSGGAWSRAFVRPVRFESGEWHFNPKVIQDNYDFSTSSVMGGNFFFGSEFSWFLHTTYFGMYIVLTQALLYEIFKSKTEKKHKLFLTTGYALLFIPLFLLSSKAAILSSLLLTFYILLTSRAVAKLKILIIIAFIIASVLFFFFNPRLKDLKDNFFNTEQVLDPKARYGHPVRLLSWDASIDVIKDNWLIGVGEANKENVLIEKYIEKGYDFPAQEKLNTHNQYFDFMLGGGIFGVGLFVAGLMALMIRAVRQENFLLMVFVGLILFNALFENLLTLYSGIGFFSLFIVLFDFKLQPNQNIVVHS